MPIEIVIEHFLNIREKKIIRMSNFWGKLDALRTYYIRSDLYFFFRVDIITT